MPRYFLELSYKGTAYSGFQIQENALTIQAEVEKALQTFFRQPFELTGSSRTDAGVHARQNYFHFDTDIPVQSRNVYNLNALVPPDIAIKGIYPVPDQAHCRFDAIAREYHYYIYREKDPFMADRGWLFPYPVNIGFLQEAAALLTSYHDFTSFSKRNTQVNNFICKIEMAGWTEEAGHLVFKVRGNRFLRGMVRGLVGTMLRTARSSENIDKFRDVITARDCSRADFSTPPQGLFLQKVMYNESLQPLLIQTA